MSTIETRIPVPRFHDGTKDDFVLWKLRIQTELEDNNCLKIVLGTKPAPTEEHGVLAMEMYGKRKKKAMSILIKGLGDKPLKAIQRYAADPAATWTKLQERYASKSTSTRMMLLNELFNLKYSPSVPMDDHITNFELITSKLSAAGYDLDKLLQVTLLLSSVSGAPTTTQQSRPSGPWTRRRRPGRQSAPALSMSRKSGPLPPPQRPT